MSSRKKLKRQKRAQEAASLRQAVGVAGRTDLPASEAAQRADEASEQEGKQ